MTSVQEKFCPTCFDTFTSGNCQREHNNKSTVTEAVATKLLEAHNKELSKYVGPTNPKNWKLPPFVDIRMFCSNCFDVESMNRATMWQNMPSIYHIGCTKLSNVPKSRVQKIYEQHQRLLAHAKAKEVGLRSNPSSARRNICLAGTAILGVAIAITALCVRSFYP